MSESSEEQYQPDFTDRCSWCNKRGLMWILDHKTNHWHLIEQTGKNHIHQPQMERTNENG